MPVTQPFSSHAQHDALLIAKLAANDVNSPERVRAMALVAECAECEALLQDLQAIAAASRAMPAPVRRRDFRLTEADAARLRAPGWRAWRTWLERLAAPRFAFTQRVGLGMAALGIAGLLFASLPSSVLTGGTSTTLEHAGAPLGTAGPVTDTTVAAPTAPATSKNAQPIPAQPSDAGGPSVSSESIASDQSAAPSAAAGGAAPAPTAGPSAASQLAPVAVPTAAPTGAPAAAASSGPSAAPASGGFSTIAGASPAGSQPPVASDGSQSGAAAPPAAAASPPPAPQATGIARGVPQGASPATGRAAGENDSGLGLSPLALVSIVVFVLGLGLLLARRMALALTRR